MYGKIFERMFTGTMYGSGPVVFAVWAYVIACARPPGVITLNQKLLAATIGCSTEEIRAAIDFLMRPDENSATSDEDGRRLVHVSGLDYHVVSWQKYRDMRDESYRRDYMREYMRNRRSVNANKANAANGKQGKQRKQKTRIDAKTTKQEPFELTDIASQEVNEIGENSAENQHLGDFGEGCKTSKQKLAKLAKAEAEAVKRVGKQSENRERGSRLSIESLPDEWRQWAEAERPALDPHRAWERFRDHWAAQPGAKGRKTDWAATWRNWVRNERPGVDLAAKRQPYEKPEWLQNIV